MRTLLASVAIGVVLCGCPKGEAPAPVKASEQAAGGEPTLRKRAKPSFREPGSKRSDALCDQLACTNEQRDNVTRILADSMPDRSDRMRRDDDALKAANAALAAAFASTSFDGGALTTFHAAETAATLGKEDARDEAVAVAVVGVHGALEPDQRTLLADIVAKEGIAPFVARGRGPKGANAEIPDETRRARRLATRLCHRVTCASDQEDKLAITLEKLPSGSEPDPEAARTALAAALRGDTLEKAAVTAYFGATDHAGKASAKQRDAAWLELHGALTPEQRKLLAESVTERGLQALHSGRARPRPGKDGPRAQRE